MHWCAPNSWLVSNNLRYFPKVKRIICEYCACMCVRLCNNWTMVCLWGSWWQVYIHVNFNIAVSMFLFSLLHFINHILEKFWPLKNYFVNQPIFPAMVFNFNMLALFILFQTRFNGFKKLEQSISRMKYRKFPIFQGLLTYNY